MQPQELSNSQINRAGKVLRAWMNGELLEGSKQREAFEALLKYRGAHQLPLVKATNGLRSMVATEGCEIEVSQRLKRVPTILDKIVREPRMQLATMQDIAGCRAVLQSIDELRRVERRVRRRRPPVRSYDYVESPRVTGYRAIHLIVEYDARRVEVQLRTVVMDEWAGTVERLGGRTREDLKSGRGPEELLDLLAELSDAMAKEERGDPVSSDQLQTIARLHERAIRYL